MSSSSGPEMRYAYLADTWVLVAPGRRDRPHDFSRPPTEERGPQACPFEPGHEAQTPPEVFALREPNSPANGPGWRVRVIPNKFPALRPDLDGAILLEDFYTVRSGFGYHEILVETPHHHHHPPAWTPEEWRDVLFVLRERMGALFQDPRVAYVLAFRNHGQESGASLAHPHSQIVALPLVPKEARVRFRQMETYAREHGTCYLCREAAYEQAQKIRMVYENEAFAAYCPFASRFALEMRIVPKAHAHDFTALPEAWLLALGDALQQALRALDCLVPQAPYNLLVHTAPSPRVLGGDAGPYLHWYVEILPRLGALAGFEFGTGWFVNPVLPEEAAARLREALA